MDFDNSAQVDALAKLPPEPPKAPERSAWTVVPRGIASGAGKIGAAIVEGVAAISPSDEELRRNPGRTAFSTEDLGLTARSARDYERSLRPDPITAGAAENVVYGLVSGFTEVGIGAVVAGPAGAAAALGAGEGATVTDDLQRQGVDNRTARTAGAVTGVVNAASVALPLAGPTLKATAALYVAGGPGGFMAQQAATSEILKRAGYAKIAEQFDPLDPVGLAMSALIPLPFAAWGARNVMRGRAKGGADATAKPEVAPVPEAPIVPREAVDAAMVHNLTLQRQAQEVAQRTQSAMPDLDRAWRDLNEAPKISDFGTTPATTATGALDDFVLSRQQGNQWAALNVREFRTDGGEVVYTASLEVGADGFPKGTGAATTMYLEALNIAKQRGLGWQSEGVRSDNALAIYRRLTDAGVPFREVDGVSAIDADALAGVDLPKVAQLVAEMSAKKADALGAAPVKADAAPPPAPKPEPATPYGALTEAVTKAQDEFAAFQKAGGTLDQFIAQRELPPAEAVQQMRNAEAEALPPIPDQVGTGFASAPLPQGSRRAIEATLLLEGKQQTRYMGNKREFFQENAKFIAKDVAPLMQQADTLFDMYAGGGTYGLTTALSGAMPNLKRVVVNEVDPLRAARFRLAAEHGADIMKPWETDPKLVELANELRPLVGKSSTPASLAMSVYQGDSKSPKYQRFAELALRHGEHADASQVAKLALNDVFFSGRTASWDRLLKTAAQDADRIHQLVKRVKSKGVEVEVSSFDSLGPEAIAMVRAKGGNAAVMLDPPYHTTTSGTYSAGGKKFDFASDDFLAANLAAAKEMSEGNVVLYNNKDTPQVRQHFSANFRGSMSMRGWKRQNGQREFLGVYDGRSKSGIPGLPVGDTAGQLGVRTDDFPGGVLDGPGGDPGGPAQASAPAAVPGAENGAPGTADVAPYGALTEAVAKAQDEFAAFQKAGGTLDQFLAQRELPPAVNNLLIGLTETMKDPRRAKALLDLVAKNAGDATKSAADVTADAVEGARVLTDADLTNTPPDTIAAKPDPLMQSVTERVAAVELANPDMVVGTTDSGNPITVRDELARIRKEAFEGTDVELGAKDADLVSVAANCALTNGG